MKRYNLFNKFVFHLKKHSCSLFVIKTKFLFLTFAFLSFSVDWNDFKSVFFLSFLLQLEVFLISHKSENG